MKNIEKRLVYLGCLLLLIITFFPAVISLLSNYKSVDSFQIYSVIIIVLTIFLFIFFADMKKLKNIIILIILNFSILIVPGSIVYLYNMYNSDISNNSYILHILNYLSEGAHLTWLLPAVLFNSISIFLFILEYKRTK